MTDPLATRGARKLHAALEAFELAPCIAGARALDVGASTGGFTATLLAHGARHVTAIDVGRGQLAQPLRADPRVTLHEQTDFRRAPLALAPGPFDFFTVDVSFMAARNVLRALAFRLAPGAQGVVLLKPQFELPASLVRGGDVSDPRLRRRAYARFEERALALGFRVLARRESDVAGGSGTIEMPLHLRFAERPAALPRPGEQRRTAAPAKVAKPARTASAKESRTWFAVAAPGLEGLLAQELAAIAGVQDAREQPGGVEFHGDLGAGCAVNLHSRVATRVLARIGEANAREFGELRRRLARLDFAAFVAMDRPLRIDVAARGCRLYHTKALAETLLLAASDAVGRQLAPALPQAEVATDADADRTLAGGEEPFQRLLLRGERDRFTVSADSSGALLHRRGARVETGRAPLRETLAAATLMLAGYTGEEQLVNAMCGAGTLALEAVDIALGRAPGRRRAFALETFPCFRAEQLAELRAQAARAQRSQLRAPIHAFDRDPSAVELARRNAERGDAAAHVQLACADLLDCAAPEGGGLLVANPPYGKRLGRAREVQTLYRAIGDRLRSAWRGYRVALLVARDVRADVFGLSGLRSIALSNGGIAIKLLVGEVGDSGGARRRRRRRVRE